MKLLVVGCGITGSSLSKFLKEVSNRGKIDIHLFDKARGCGGRMSTKRFNNLNETSFVDLGAQYFSATQDQIAKYEKLVKELEDKNVIRKIDLSMIKNPPNSHKKLDHYLPNFGSNSVIKYLLKDQNNIKYNTLVKGFSINGSKCLVQYIENNEINNNEFDCIVFTCPVPQINQMIGISECENQDIVEKLKNVKYSSRFALGVFFDEYSKWMDELPVMQYISKETSEIIAYIAVDNKKYLKNDSKMVSICIHTRSFPFGLENIEKSLDEIQPIVMKELCKLYPKFSENCHVICHKWRYSQIHQKYEEPDKFVVLNKKPLIIAGGDGFHNSSGLFYCLDSARDISDFIDRNM